MLDFTKLKPFRNLDVPPNKSFGFTMAVILIIIAVIPVFKNKSFASIQYWALAAAAFFLLGALIYPKALTLFNQLWTIFGFLMSKITTPVLLVAVYFLFITPFAIILKLTKRDNLRLKFEDNTASYWIEEKEQEPLNKTMHQQL